MLNVNSFRAPLRPVVGSGVRVLAVALALGGLTWTARAASSVPQPLPGWSVEVVAEAPEERETLTDAGGERDTLTVALSEGEAGGEREAAVDADAEPLTVGERESAGEADDEPLTEGEREATPDADGDKV